MKVILHGEHSVVYGKMALAVSIDLRTKVVATRQQRQLGAEPQVAQKVLGTLYSKSDTIRLVHFLITQHIEGISVKLQISTYAVFFCAPLTPGKIPGHSEAAQLWGHLGLRLGRAPLLVDNETEPVHFENPRRGMAVEDPRVHRQQEVQK